MIRVPKPVPGVDPHNHLGLNHRAVEELQRNTAQLYDRYLEIEQDFSGWSFDSAATIPDTAAGRAVLSAASGEILAQAPLPAGSRVHKIEVFGTNPSALVRQAIVSIRESRTERISAGVTVFVSRDSLTTTSLGWSMSFEGTPAKLPHTVQRGRRLYVHIQGDGTPATSVNIDLIRWTYQLPVLQ